MTTVLFLDFDGVLHPASVTRPPWLFANATHVAAAIAPWRDLRVVVTSTWRERRTCDELRELLPSELALRVVGATPKLRRESEMGHRQLEVTAWLHAHAPWASWVALDDDPRLYRPLERRLFRCDPLRGLTADCVPQLQAKLMEQIGRG